MFKELLKKEIIGNLKNYYTDNYYFQPAKPPLSKKTINFFKRIIYTPCILGLFLKSDFFFANIFLRIYGLNKYLNSFNFFYNNLNDEQSKKLLLQLLSYKILGSVKVKLPLNNPEYWSNLKQIETTADPNSLIKLSYVPWTLYLHKFRQGDTLFEFYLNAKTILTTFVLKQYEYRCGNFSIQVQPGDNVIDLGGCYGDTAIYFARETGNHGKVFSFEFIPSNIEIFTQNIKLNQLKNIQLVPNPVWENSGKKVFYADLGASSSVSFSKTNNSEEVDTLCIDDLVQKENVPEINFIKADVEGAEMFALKGALRTIKKDKPKLAISIYHSREDFVNIIKFIDDLNLGYKFYLGHFTFGNAETVLFATI